jgi:hypothetical protein
MLVQWVQSVQSVQQDPERLTSAQWGQWVQKHLVRQRFPSDRCLLSDRRDPARRHPSGQWDPSDRSLLVRLLCPSDRWGRVRSRSARSDPYHPSDPSVPWGQRGLALRPCPWDLWDLGQWTWDLWGQSDLCRQEHRLYRSGRSARWVPEPWTWDRWDLCHQSVLGCQRQSVPWDLRGLAPSRSDPSDRSAPSDPASRHQWDQSGQWDQSLPARRGHPRDLWGRAPRSPPRSAR